MIATGQNIDIISINLINQPVLLINPPAPESGQITSQWFWLSNAFIPITLNILDQIVDAF